MRNIVIGHTTQHIHLSLCNCIIFLPCSPKMYTSMAERHRYREVLAYTTVVILATYLFIMGAGYYYFAQFTLSPGEYCVCFFACFLLYPYGMLFHACSAKCVVLCLYC